MNERETVSEKVQRMWPELMTYDTALPQPWVDMIWKKYDKDVRGHFVWGYYGNSVFGGPFPITEEGVLILHRLS